MGIFSYSSIPALPSIASLLYFPIQLERAQLASDLADLQRRFDALERASDAAAARHVETAAALQTEAERRTRADTALAAARDECNALRRALALAEADRGHMEARLGPEHQRRVALEGALREVRAVYDTVCSISFCSLPIPDCPLFHLDDVV